MDDHNDASAMAKIEELCRARDVSVSTRYAENPGKSPGDLALALYGSHHLTVPVTKALERRNTVATDLNWARRCGNFADSNPSDLFLHAFHDLLQCLKKDPLAGCVSPSLIGSTGFVPMTIIGPLNDQLRHMSNLIVRAKREVLLATNFWKSSGASHFVNDAMIELSRRAGERGERIVFKLMFDRGSIKQVCRTKFNSIHLIIY